MDDWRAREMPETMARLAERGGEGKVRTLVADVLRYGLGVRDLSHEFRVPEVRGRIDALFGATVFEFKSDLRRERVDAEEQLLRYLTERERATRERYARRLLSNRALLSITRLIGLLAATSTKRIF